MIHDKIQDNSGMNGGCVILFLFIFRLLLMKLRIQFSDLCEVTLYHENERDCPVVFSPLNRC